MKAMYKAGERGMVNRTTANALLFPMSEHVTAQALDVMHVLLPTMAGEANECIARAVGFRVEYFQS